MSEFETYWGTSLGSGFSTKFLHFFFFSDHIAQTYLTYFNQVWSHFTTKFDAISFKFTWQIPIKIIAILLTNSCGHLVQVYLANLHQVWSHRFPLNWNTYSRILYSVIFSIKWRPIPPLCQQVRGCNRRTFGDCFSLNLHPNEGHQMETYSATMPGSSRLQWEDIRLQFAPELGPFR